MNTSVSRFFQIAIWTPAALFLSLPLLEHLSRGTKNFESMFLTYGLWFGTPAYLIFAIWAKWNIKKRWEPVIARLIWWAPVIFIPFYGVPWILYGLLHIAMGEPSGIGMALLWVAFSPYIIIIGYLFSWATFVIYEMFFKTINTGHEGMRVTTNIIPHMAGDAKFFGNKI